MSFIMGITNYFIYLSTYLQALVNAWSSYKASSTKISRRIILPSGFNSCGVTDGVTSLEYNETHFAEP